MKAYNLNYPIRKIVPEAKSSIVADLRAMKAKGWDGIALNFIVDFQLLQTNEILTSSIDLFLKICYDFYELEYSVVIPPEIRQKSETEQSIDSIIQYLFGSPLKLSLNTMFLPQEEKKPTPECLNLDSKGKKPFFLFKRITVEGKNVNNVNFLTQRFNIFDICAANILQEEELGTVIQKASPDIVCFSRHLSTKFRNKVLEASRRGMFIEIEFSGSQLTNPVNVPKLNNLKNLVRMTKGNFTIITGCCFNSYEKKLELEKKPNTPVENFENQILSPFDIASFLSIFALDPKFSKSIPSSFCESVLAHGRERKSVKGILRVSTLPSKPEFEDLSVFALPQSVDPNSNNASKKQQDKGKERQGGRGKKRKFGE